MAAVADIAAWLAGVAATGWAWNALTPAGGATRLQRVASAALAGWVLEGLVLSLLAGIGAAITPFAALAPVGPALLIVYRRRSPAPAPSAAAPRMRGAALALLAVAGARVAAQLWSWPWAQPWSWDVYAVWGFKARFLVTTGGLWRYLGLAPTYPFSSADYPPLQSAQLAAISWPAGDACHAAIPDLVLLIAAGALLFELWRALVGDVGAASCVLLLAWPAFPLSAALVGLADRQLALLAAVVAAIALAPRDRQDPRVLGVALAGLAMVKNEGLPFAALLALGAWLANGRRREMALPALGLLPAAVWHGATATLGTSSARLAGFTAPADLWIALRAALRASASLAAVPDWTVPMIAAALGVTVLMGAPRARWVAVAICAQLGILTVAIVAGPYPLVWQLSTALPRLATQLFPVGLACLAGSAAWLSGGPRGRDTRQGTA